MTIRIVRGNPTPEELAAALAVVRARAAAAAGPPGAPAARDAWSDPAAPGRPPAARAGAGRLDPDLLAGLNRHDRAPSPAPRTIRSERP